MKSTLLSILAVLVVIIFTQCGDDVKKAFKEADKKALDDCE
jgi:hypothetical protein